MQGKGMSENNQLLLLLLFEWPHVTMHCFKMLLFLFSAIEITTLHTHIMKFMPHVEAKKCWTQIFSLTGKLCLHNILHLVEIGIVFPISNSSGKSFFNICKNDDKIGKRNICKNCIWFFFLNIKSNFKTKKLVVFKYNIF